MRFNRLSALSLAFAGVGLSACASAPPDTATNIDRATTADRTCIRKNEINSMGALENDRYVFVNVGAARYHLLSLDKGCLGITFATGIAIADNARRVCGDGFSFLTFNHPEYGATRCRVLWIDQVENKQEARELIEAMDSDEAERK